MTSPRTDTRASPEPDPGPPSSKTTTVLAPVRAARLPHRGTAPRLAHRTVASLAAVIALLSPVAGAIPAGPPPPTPDCVRSSDTVARFLRSVDRGEAVLFGQTLAGDQIRPVRVEYAYDLESRAQTVSVRAELRSAIPVPSNDTMVVRSVAAVLGNDGGIARIDAYVTLR